MQTNSAILDNELCMLFQKAKTEHEQQHVRKVFSFFYLIKGVSKDILMIQNLKVSQNFSTNYLVKRKLAHC
jgi:hypothetical protein